MAITISLDTTRVSNYNSKDVNSGLTVVAREEMLKLYTVPMEH